MVLTLGAASIVHAQGGGTGVMPPQEISRIANSWDSSGPVRMNLQEEPLLATVRTRLGEYLRIAAYNAVKQEVSRQLSERAELLDSERRIILLERASKLVEEVFPNFNSSAKLAFDYAERLQLASTSAHNRLIYQNWLAISLSNFEDARTENVGMLLSTNFLPESDKTPLIDIPALKTVLFSRIAHEIGRRAPKREIEIRDELGNPKAKHDVTKADMVQLLADIATSKPTDQVNHLLYIRPLLSTLGIYEEVYQEFRIYALNALAAIRSISSYYWISLCIGDLNEDRTESIVSKEAKRIMAHSDLCDGNNCQVHTGYFYTGNKRIALALARANRARRNPYARETILLQAFQSLLEKSARRDRAGRDSNTPFQELTDDDLLFIDNGTGGKRFEELIRSLERNSPREPSDDTETLAFLTNGRQPLGEMLRHISKIYETPQTFREKARLWLGMEPDESAKSWMARKCPRIWSSGRSATPAYAP